jgi:hypothetical protein
MSNPQIANCLAMPDCKTFPSQWQDRNKCHRLLTAMGWANLWVGRAQDNAQQLVLLPKLLLFATLPGQRRDFPIDFANLAMQVCDYPPVD